jgi:hypothetical protein
MSLFPYFRNAPGLCAVQRVASEADTVQDQLMVGETALALSYLMRHLAQANKSRDSIPETPIEQLRQRSLD